jgi:hypothetical protein
MMYDIIFLYANLYIYKEANHLHAYVIGSAGGEEGTGVLLPWYG